MHESGKREQRSGKKDESRSIAADEKAKGRMRLERRNVGAENCQLASSRQSEKYK